MQNTTRATLLAVAVGAAFAALPGLSLAQNGAGPDRIGGQPNLNGIWQAIGTANWNLEAHSAEAIPEAWELGAIGAIPAGRSYVRTNNGKIPYTAEGLAKREELRAGWPQNDPETACYLPGIPRATYMPYPFQIVQGGGDILFVYEYGSTNRNVHMSDHEEPPVDTWMGHSNGRFEGDVLVIETTGFNDRSWFDRAGNHHSNQLKVTERFELSDDKNHMTYTATMEDPETFTEPWTISMPLYRVLDENAQILEYKCVPFAEELLYKDLELTE